MFIMERRAGPDPGAGTVSIVKSEMEIILWDILVFTNELTLENFSIYSPFLALLRQLSIIIIFF